MLTVTNPPASAGFLDTVYDTGSKACSWLNDKTKAFAASASETWSKVWAAISEFFSSATTKIGEWLSAAKEGLIAAKDQIVALPKEAKIVGAISAAVAVLLGCFLGRCWGSTAPTTPPPANSAQQTQQQTQTPNQNQ